MDDPYSDFKTVEWDESSAKIVIKCPNKVRTNDEFKILVWHKNCAIVEANPRSESQFASPFPGPHPLNLKVITDS